MTTNNFQVHPQLMADSHALFQWQKCHLRLHNNATFPWLIIIPETALIEYHDLSATFQSTITRISQTSSKWFRTEFHCEKFNFAAIGNVVQQLHIHLIGRNSQDPLWPDVVWGHDLPQEKYQPGEIEHFKKNLKIQLEALT